MGVCLAVGLGCQPAPADSAVSVQVADPEAPEEDEEDPDAELVLPRALPPPDRVVTPPSDFGQCLRSRMCQFEGFCSPSDEGQCIAASDDDCKGSDACLGGRCSARNGVCVAASDEDCRGSWACKGWGRCNFDGTDACIATSAADCAASTRCQREGECRLAGDECVARPGAKSAP
jgi:hypothetical protein